MAKPHRISLEKIDYCNNSSMFRAYKSLVDFDSIKFRAEREMVKFAGRHLDRKQRKRFLKIWRMTTEDFEAGQLAKGK